MKKGSEAVRWPLTGNEEITKYLAKSIYQGKASSAYIFSGPENLGKNTMAFIFAQALLCQGGGERQADIPCGKCGSCRQMLIGVAPKKRKSLLLAEKTEQLSIHADFHYLKKADDKKNISIEQIRGFIDCLSLSSFGGKNKVGLIKGAETLSDAAANALLKTLEEPRKNVIILLTTSQIDLVPQTIVSRCQILDFRLVDWEKIYDFLLSEYGLGRAEAKNYARLALGRPALAARLVENPDFRKRYEADLDLFFGLVRSGAAERMRLMKPLLDSKKETQETARRISRAIEVWQGIARDIVLLSYGNNDIVQHELRKAELERAAQDFGLVRAISWQAMLKRAREYLRGNVAPKLVLDYLSINI